MSGSELVVGLDIGTTKILALVGEAAGDRVRLLGAGHAASTGLHKGALVDMVETAAAIRQAVSAAERSAAVRIGSALVSLSGEHLVSLNSRGGVPVGEGREVAEADVRAARRAARQATEVVCGAPDRTILHNIPRQYILDGQAGVRHPIGMAADFLEVETHVITAGAAFVENLARCVRRADFDVEELVATPLAAGLAVTTEAEQALGVLTVDVGGGATHLAVFTDGSIASSSALPVGGGHLSYDLSVGLRVTREEAERLKRESGCARVEEVPEGEMVTLQRVGDEEPRAMPRRVIAEVLQPRVAQLAGLVREQVEPLAEQGVLPISMVLTGGGSLLPGLRALFSHELGLPARLGLPRHLEGPDAVLQSPAAAAAAGLLHYGAMRRGGGGLSPGWSGGLFRRLREWLRR